MGRRVRNPITGSGSLRTVAAFLLLVPIGCRIGAGDDVPQITVGAVTFAENQIVAEIYAQVLEAAGYRVQRRFNFQNREALQPAMHSGAIDLAPEYLASLLTALDPRAQPSADAEDNLSALEPLLAGMGLSLLRPSSANNTNAIVVDSATAMRLDLSEVSDLRSVASRLTFGGPPECPDRFFCLKGLREVYGIRFKSFQPFDAGGPLTTAALSAGKIDVALLFSTSGIIVERGWVVLEDDKGLQAADNITPVIRDDALDDDTARLLNSASDSLTTDTMTALNARVEVSNENFRDVAQSFLEQEDLI